MKFDAENLKEKGWSQEEIEKASKILEEAPEKKSSTVIIIDEIAYWSGLILAILGNFVISVVLIPFLIVIKTVYLYLALIFLGVSFGWLFSILIDDIEKIKSSPHIVAWIFIPSIAVINIFIMVNLANHIAKLMEMSSSVHQAPFVSFVYVLSFMMPYLTLKFIKK